MDPDAPNPPKPSEPFSPTCRVPFSAQNTPQFIFLKVGVFFAPQNHHKIHHNLPPKNHHETTQKPRFSPEIAKNPSKKNYRPSRNRTASRSGSPAIKILPCAAVRSYGTRRYSIVLASES
jgi:hypothetical protein